MELAEDRIWREALTAYVRKAGLSGPAASSALKSSITFSDEQRAAVADMMTNVRLARENGQTLEQFTLEWCLADYPDDVLAIQAELIRVCWASWDALYALRRATN